MLLRIELSVSARHDTTRTAARVAAADGAASTWAIIVSVHVNNVVWSLIG